VKGLVSIIMVAYNKLELSRACIESVLRYTSLPYELILVDNGSRDGTRNYFLALARDLTRVQAVIKPRNFGAYARSFGMEVARGEFLCWLDNDVVVGPGWLETLMGAFADPRVGGAGAEGVVLTADWQHRLHTKGRPPQEVDGLAVDILVGYCAVFRNLVHYVGYLDPQFYPLWNEDADYSFRVKLLGYKLVVRPANVRHREHGTGLVGTGDPGSHIARMNQALIRKWEPFKGRVLEVYRT